MLLTGTVPALKNRFLGHFCVTDTQTHLQTHIEKGEKFMVNIEIAICQSAPLTYPREAGKCF